MSPLILLQMVLGLGLFYSGFCRLVMTNQYTLREVRWAIWFEAVMGSLTAGAPVIPLMVPEVYWQAWETPTWVWLALLSSATFLQIVVRRYWNDGVPHEVQNENTDDSDNFEHFNSMR